MIGRRRHTSDDLARAAHIAEVRTLVNLAESYDAAEAARPSAPEVLEEWLARLRIEVPEAYVRRHMPARQYASDLLAIARAVRRLDEDPRLGLAAAGYAVPDGPAAVAHDARGALLDLDVALEELAADSHERTAAAAALRLGAASTHRTDPV